jgi:hypothetical protein
MTFLFKFEIDPFPLFLSSKKRENGLDERCNGYSFLSLLSLSDFSDSIFSGSDVADLKLFIAFPMPAPIYGAGIGRVTNSYFFNNQIIIINYAF